MHRHPLSHVCMQIRCRYGSMMDNTRENVRNDHQLITKSLSFVNCKLTKFSIIMQIKCDFDTSFNVLLLIINFGRF